MSERAALTVKEYREEIEVLEETGGAYAIIGGMAVQVWAERYLEDEDLESEHPLVSKDLDARGKRVHALAIRGLWSLTDPDSTSVELKWKGMDWRSWALTRPSDRKTVEITEYVPGVDSSTRHNGYNLRIEHAGMRMHVLDPISCLEAKVDVLSREMEANARGERNDVAHCKALLAVLPGWNAKRGQVQICNI